MKRLLIYLPIVLLIASSCRNVRIKERERFGEILKSHQVTGGFEIFDNNKEIANYYNREACSKAYIPGDLNDIMTALIALEEAVVLDENKPSNWLKDYQEYDNKEQTLRQAFTDYDTAFFSLLNQQLNHYSIRSYLDTIQFKNDTISKGQYWNDGSFSVTPDEFVGVMKRLYFKEVPGISGRVQTIMNSMLLQHQNDSTKLYYRMATVTMNDTVYQQIVGFAENYNPLVNPESKKLEKIIHPYFFALVVSPQNDRILTVEELKKMLYQLLECYKVKVE